MGCWNGTCAISQLTILAGEPCRIVFLRGKQAHSRSGEAGSGFCYTTGLWTQASLAIPGKYDDYGAIEDIDPEDWRAKQFIDWVLDSIQETKMGPNSVHDTPITKDRIREGGIHELCRIIHSQPQRVRVSDGISRSIWASMDHYMKEAGETLGPYQPDALAYCLIREDIYQALSTRPIKGWRGTETVEGYYYTKIDEWAETLLKSLTGEDARKDEGFVRSMIHLSGPRLWRENEGAGHLMGHLERMFLDEVFTVVEANGDVAACLEAMKPRHQQIARFRWVDWQMGRIRKFWSPQSGAGSQDDCIEAHEEFLGIVAQALKTQKAHFSEEEPEEITAAFWASYTPPRPTALPVIKRSQERCKLANLKDANDEPIPGITDAVGDGDGYGSLYVVDPEPDANLAHDHLYFVISEAGEVEQAIHGWPLGGMYGDIAITVPPEDWRFGG